MPPRIAFTVATASSLAFVMMVAAFARAPVSWVSNANGVWHDGFNWSTGAPPSPGDDVTISVPASIVVTHDTGESFVDSLVTDERLRVIGASALGVSGSAELSSLTTIDTFGGLFTLQPASQIDLLGPTLWLRGTFGGPGTITNRHVLTITGAGETTLGAMLRNEAAVVQEEPMTVTLGGAIFNARGATWTSHASLTGGFGNDLENAGLIVVVAGAGATMQDLAVTNTGTIRVDPDAQVDFAGGSFENAGTLLVDSGATLTIAGGYVQTAGSTNVEGGTLAAPGGVQVVGGTIGCYGPVISNLVVGTQFGGPGAGVVGDPVSLADPRPSPSTMCVEGSYIQGLDGGLEIGFDDVDPPVGCPGGAPGSPPHDVLAVSGVATIGGTLVVHLENGFDPPDGTTYAVLTAESVIGTFDALDTPALAGGRMFEVQYGPSSVRLKVVPAPCIGDVNLDDAVNTLDLLLVLTAWGDCPGCGEDVDGDGVVNVVDLITLLTAWGACG